MSGRGRAILAFLDLFGDRDGLGEHLVGNDIWALFKACNKGTPLKQGAQGPAKPGRFNYG
jgi:hypothetical protein